MIKVDWEVYRDWVKNSPHTTFRLLSKNKKILKQDGKGWLSYCLHLSPHVESIPHGGINMCPKASVGCSATCLTNTGLHRMGQAKKRRIERTLWYLKDPVNFLHRLKTEIRFASVRAGKKNLELAVRLDGLSDVGMGGNLCMEFPDVIFYDYTKVPSRMFKYIEYKRDDVFNYPHNYFLTFSYSGRNGDYCYKILQMGGNIAVVFHPDYPLPQEFFGVKVLDGTEDDRRFLDPEEHGCVIGLKFLGSPKKLEIALRTGFCVIPTEVIK